MMQLMYRSCFSLLSKCGATAASWQRLTETPALLLLTASTCVSSSRNSASPSSANISDTFFWDSCSIRLSAKRAKKRGSTGVAHCLKDGQASTYQRWASTAPFAVLSEAAPAARLMLSVDLPKAVCSPRRIVLACVEEAVAQRLADELANG